MSGHLSVKLVFVSAVGVFMLLGCAPPAAPRGRLAADIDVACGGAAWRQRHALAADVTIRRDGHPDLRGLLLYDTRRDRLVIEFPGPHGGLTSCGFDGSTLWADGPDASGFDDWARILQWARWVAVPYRLTNSAFRVKEVHPLLMAGESYRVAEIQRPTDGPALCALFIDPGTLRPRGAVPVSPADQPIDAIAPAYGLAYEQFSVCEDVSIPVRWSVWDWNARAGIGRHGPVATVMLDNPRFVEPDPVQFSPPRLESALPSTSGPTESRGMPVKELAGANPWTDRSQWVPATEHSVRGGPNRVEGIITSLTSRLLTVNLTTFRFIARTGMDDAAACCSAMDCGIRLYCNGEGGIRTPVTV